MPILECFGVWGEGCPTGAKIGPTCHLVRKPRTAIRAKSTKIHRDVSRHVLLTHTDAWDILARPEEKPSARDTLQRGLGCSCSVPLTSRDQRVDLCPTAGPSNRPVRDVAVLCPECSRSEAGGLLCVSSHMWYLARLGSPGPVCCVGQGRHRPHLMLDFAQRVC